jgi:Tol biopolymer transport system component
MPLLAIGFASICAAPLWATGADKLLTDNSGCNGVVDAFAEGPDGRIYVGGDFTVCGGVATQGIAVYDPLTARFAPLGSGIPTGGVYALAFHRGELYAGGGFHRAGGVIVDKVARWDGSRWAPVGDPNEIPVFDPRWDGPVSALVEFQGQLYAGGSFNNIGRTQATNVARWDGNQWTDVPLFGSVVDSVSALAVFQGELYAGGKSGAVPGGVEYRHIARYDGTQWRTVGAGVEAANPQTAVFVSAFVVHAGELYVGGRFARAGGVVAAGIARWDGEQWSPVGDGLTGGDVYVLADFAGELFAGGRFTMSPTGRNLGQLARWNGQSWSRVGDFDGPIEVRVAALQSTASQLYVGGSYTQIDGLSSSHVARWDTREWQPLDRLPPSGIVGYTQSLALTTDALYVGGQFTMAGGVPARSIARWNGSSWAPLQGPGGEGVNSLVTAIAVSGTDVYVGGYFSEAGGVAANHIARWDGSRWQTIGEGANNGLDGPVHMIQIAADGIYVGGEFQRAGDQPARHLAVWRDGRWQGFGDGPPRPVHSLALSESAIFAGGGLRPAVGTSEMRVDVWNGQSWAQIYDGGGGPLTSLLMFQGHPHMAYFNAVRTWDGQTWLPLPAVTDGTPIIPLGLVVHRDQLYASGYFTLNPTGPDVPARRKARWDGSRWLPFWTEQPLRTSFRGLASNGIGLADIDSDGLRMSPSPVLHSVSVETGAAGGASTTPVVARNGIRLAFASTASDLVSGGSNGRSHIYLRAPASGQTERISDRVSALLPTASEDYSEPSLSADGASIVFSGSAGQVWAVIHGVPRLASSNLAGAPGNGPSQRPMLAGKGRYLVFESRADNLAAADGNGAVSDILRKDLETGAVTLISVGAAGESGNGASSAPWASDDGRSVAFISSAGNLTSTPGNAHAQALLLRDDPATPQRLLLSRNLATGEAGNAPSSDVRITPDGRFGVFASSASNLVADDGNNASDIFYFEIGSAGVVRLERLSVSIYGEEGNAGSFAPSIRDDGSLVVFATDASNLVELDINGQRDVLLKDTGSRNVQRLSRSADGLQPNGASDHPMLAGDGSAIVFQSAARNLVAADSDADVDVYAVTLIDRTLVAIDTPLDEPRVEQFALPAPSPPNLQCPGGFFVATITDGPGAGVTPGLFGVELLLDEPGTRTLAGGLNFGGTADVDQAGFAGFNIANTAHEPQRFNLRVTGNPISDSETSVVVRIRVARRTATSSDTVYETETTVSRAQAHVHSLVLPPAFYEVTVTPQVGTPRGDADADFFVEATTSFVDRPGGGFQGGAVVGGYHSAAPGNGASGFAGFCLATPHTTSVRVLSRPSYGEQGARDLRLRLLDGQLQSIGVMPTD